MRQDEAGEWICPKSEEVLEMAGVLTILEEYVHPEEARDDHEIRTNEEYMDGKLKSSRKIDSITIAMTLQRLSRARRPTVNPQRMPPASTHVIYILFTAYALQ
jgi:hypothetical protein